MIAIRTSLSRLRSCTSSMMTWDTPSSMALFWSCSSAMPTYHEADQSSNTYVFMRPVVQNNRRVDFDALSRGQQCKCRTYFIPTWLPCELSNRRWILSARIAPGQHARQQQWLPSDGAVCIGCYMILRILAQSHHPARTVVSALSCRILSGHKSLQLARIERPGGWFPYGCAQVARLSFAASIGRVLGNLQSC